MTGNTASFMHLATPSDTNAFVANGKLVVVPTLSEPVLGPLDTSTVDLWGDSPATQCTSNYNQGCLQTGNAARILPPVMSAMLRTEKSFSFRYGRVEVRAKLPSGQWLRPVFRLLPKYDSYGEWPQSGEMIVLEGNHGFATSHVHYGPYNISYGEASKMIPLDDDEFHVFGLYWDEHELYTYLDTRENVVARLTGFGSHPLWNERWGDNETSPWRGRRVQAPFDQLFYLSVGLRVGGTDGFFPDGVDGKPWNDTAIDHKATFYRAKDTWWPTWANASGRFEIDDVSVWATSEASNWAYHGAFDKAPAPKSDVLLFSDSFETLEMRHWKPEITMNTHGEFQMFVNHRQTGFVRDATLFLRPTLSADIIGNWSLYQGYIDMWGTDLPSKCTSAAASGCGHL
ncbi:hypothetical protein As57867_007092, partial [Aphanomyces stellatus]